MNDWHVTVNNLVNKMKKKYKTLFYSNKLQMRKWALYLCTVARIREYLVHVQKIKTSCKTTCSNFACFFSHSSSKAGSASLVFPSNSDLGLNQVFWNDFSFITKTCYVWMHQGYWDAFYFVHQFSPCQSLEISLDSLIENDVASK